MDLDRFQARGEPHWSKAEALLARTSRGRPKGLDLTELDDLAAAHRRVVSDLAVARTWFPGSDLEHRLRRLAFAGHRVLTRVEEPLLPRLIHYLRVGYPQRFREAWPALSTAAALFLGACVLGFVVGAARSEFAALFVGADALAEMRHGRIWTDEVGHMVPPALLSSKIFTNNISVVLLAWASGALLGLGSLYVVVMNGVMFGSVLAIAWRYELLDRLFAWIAAHGPLELFLITVGVAAGFELAWGQLAWRNRARSEVFAEQARRSLMLVGGTLPWLVLLGLVEGYISPQVDLSTPAKGALGLALFGAFFAYVLMGGRQAPTPTPVPARATP